MELYMQIELIDQLYRENLPRFKRTVLKRNWDSVIIVLDGIYYIHPKGSKEPMLVGKNEIAFIPAGTEITRSITEPATYYSLFFTSQIDHPFRISLLPCKLSIPETQIKAITNSLEHAFPIPHNRELLAHLVERILTDNYLFDKSKKINLPRVSDEVKIAIRYMNAHLSEELSVDELASRVYLSRTGLIWKFKHELNTTPLQHLILLRLRYAKHLLLDQQYSIGEVAEQCGYANPYYFTNCFRKYYGMSPTAFRKKHLGNTEAEKQLT